MVKTQNLKPKKHTKSLTMYVKLSCYCAFKTLLKIYFLFLKLSKQILYKALTKSVSPSLRTNLNLLHLLLAASTTLWVLLKVCGAMCSNVSIINVQSTLCLDNKIGFLLAPRGDMVVDNQAKCLPDAIETHHIY